MSVLATDLLIKSMLEFAIQDLRANDWILDDVFGGLADDPLLSPDYGWKEVQAAKNWFKETDIPVLLEFRVSDKPVMPCFSVAYNPSPERQDWSALADDGMITEMDTGKILKVYCDFTPASYNNTTGTVVLPGNLTTDVMVAGQFLVSSVTGHAYVINKVVNVDTFLISPGVQDDFTNCFISPPSSLYNVHHELTFVWEQYTIGVHAENLPANTQWLWQILIYSLGRYKEVFLEKRGYGLSTFQSTALERNANFGVQNVYSRYVTLGGRVEVSWVKFRAPRFDNVRIRLQVADGPTQPNLVGVYGTNMGDDQSWTTTDDPTEEEFD